MKFISILSLVTVSVSLFACATTHQRADSGIGSYTSSHQSSPAQQTSVVAVKEAGEAESKPVASKFELSAEAENLLNSPYAQDAANAMFDEDAGNDPETDENRQVQAERVVAISYTAPSGWKELGKDDRGLNVVAVFDDGRGARIIIRYESDSDMKGVVTSRLKRHELPGCTEMHAGYNEEGDMAMGYRLCGDGYSTATMLAIGGGHYTITGVFPVSMYAAGNQAIKQLFSSLKVVPGSWSTASGRNGKPGMGPVD